MPQDTAVKLFAQPDGVGLSFREARQAYGLCKMTVAGENEDACDNYYRLRFVEFLEMIGRVAHMKYKGSELEHIGLEKKMETVFDELFKLIGETRRDTEVQEDAESSSESDDEFDEAGPRD